MATALVVLGRARGAAGLGHLAGRGPRRAGRRRSVPTGPSPPGTRLPERVDAVMDTVGAATWSHSINALRPGGTLVICGTTSGAEPAKAELTKIFFKPLRVIGSTMGTRDELLALRPDAGRPPAPGR